MVEEDEGVEVDEHCAGCWYWGGVTEYGGGVQCQLRDGMGRVVKAGAQAFPQGNTAAEIPGVHVRFVV